MPDAYEATIRDVFPDRAPGSFTWVPEARGGAARGSGRRSGVPVGPQLRQPERLRRDARHGSVAGQPGRSRSSGWTPCRSCGSGWAPVQEPARGARPHAGPARPREGGRAGDDLQGRGDRLARGPRALPRRPRPLPAGVRAGLPQPAHGDAVVAASRPGTPGWPCSRCAGCATIPADDRLGHLRALPRRHRLGRQRHRRLGRRLEPVRPPAVPQRLLLRRLPDEPRPRRPVPGRTPRPATPASPGRAPRCAGSARPGSAATRPRWRRASAGTCCCTP